MKAAGGAARGRAERSAPWEHAGSPRGPLAPPALVTAPNTRRVGPCWCTPEARGDTLARRRDAPLTPAPDQSRATPAARDERPRPTSQPPPASRQSPPEAVAARVSLAVARAHPTARRGGGGLLHIGASLIKTHPLRRPSPLSLTFRSEPCTVTGTMADRPVHHVRQVKASGPSLATTPLPPALTPLVPVPPAKSGVCARLARQSTHRAGRHGRATFRRGEWDNAAPYTRRYTFPDAGAHQ